MRTRDPSPWHGDARRSGASIGQALWLRLRERAPWLVRLGPWGISLASLALGLCTLFVFRRGLPHVGWIVGYVLLLWLIFLFVAELRSSSARTGPHSAAMRRGPRGRHLAIGAGSVSKLDCWQNRNSRKVARSLASPTPPSGKKVGIEVAIDAIEKPSFHSVKQQQEELDALIDAQNADARLDESHARRNCRKPQRRS